MTNENEIQEDDFTIHEEGTLDYESRIPFNHIQRKYKDQYAFEVINNEAGRVQRKMAMGWKVWDKGGVETEFTYDVTQPAKMKESAGRTSKGVASVPVGRGKTGVIDAVLMYMPLDMWKKRFAAREKRARDQLMMAGQKAAETAAASVGRDVDRVQGRGLYQGGDLSLSVGNDPEAIQNEVGVKQFNS